MPVGDEERAEYLAFAKAVAVAAFPPKLEAFIFNLVPKLVVTVDAKLASSFIAAANSFKVSKAPGAESITSPILV